MDLIQGRKIDYFDDVDAWRRSVCHLLLIFVMDFLDNLASISVNASFVPALLP